ncbi:hypothetical protein WJ0W_003323 [Paenibacillus melissococcoides]|uniref:Uncharacterized protein n=1 Tax=Paenibacillus melissococcoides TaxID=2912268 RepID=A0ABM9G3H4_9BACL|nr:MULTISPECIES: hypothetical protein [Paenibacillus]MEB9893241.1 hypothetical protein [Bacillus cereus]CAH8246086.1 hypothetical protein WJ0W_003323 [Paenibacillus melissococcoides]CAH8712934.1 hypothetical protein WDD9_003402 [Paenibacillus melissococcoides]CAH8713681.1 hypothetical protein HTL2_003705 [Paenibacillus melissococcoides]GIO78714.1 hypothetical protein J6TS7_23240 [Paenibacillus dendritiformis]
MQAGWIKIHRKIADNMIFKDPFFLKLWMLCLLKAAHKPYRQFIGKKSIPLQAGQFTTGRTSLAGEFNDGLQKKDQRSPATIWRMLQVLEREEMVMISSNRSHSIVTVLNWSEYQDESGPGAAPEPDTGGDNPEATQPPAKPTKKKPEKFAEDSTYYKMATYFREKVDAMAAEHGLQHLTKRANMQSWAKDFQLLVERDGQKDKYLILAVMEWVVQDDFWMDKVLSAKKFREQFPKLVLAMQKEKKKPHMPTTRERQQQLDYDDKLREWVMQGENPDDFRYDDTS